MGLMGLDSENEDAASLTDALLVYAEPLADRAHAVVVGRSDSAVADRLLELGARSVTVFDPDLVRAQAFARNAPRGVSVRAFDGSLDVRAGEFDLAVIPDLGDVGDPVGLVTQLRSAIARDGALVALGRARTDSDDFRPFADELAPAALPYAELYELFANNFSAVTLAGVLPFAGVVFAELGREGEEPAVSVDTRLVAPEPPSVFVVVASDAGDHRAPLDAYAIVQVDELSEDEPRESALALEAVVAAAQLKSDALSTQLEELKDRVVVADVRAVETAARLDRAHHERDGALTRAMELEAVLAASQDAVAMLEQRLLEAERGCLDRDDRIAQLSAEIDSRNSSRPDMNALLVRAERAEAALAIAHDELQQRLEGNPTHVDIQIEDIGELVARAERAERELAHVGEVHTAEIAGFESQLRDRARLIASLEKELVRREQLVKELVASVEEQHHERVFEAAAPLPPPSRNDSGLRQKLELLAGEVARREGELVARGWRITELENQLRNVRPMPAAATPPVPKTKLEDELDALRQALAQEHALRVAAESGEELTRARTELARQSALLEQIRAQRESS